MDETNPEDDERGLAERSRRTFMHGAGVVGLGLATGAAVPASSSEHGDAGNETETGEGTPVEEETTRDGESTEIESCTVIDEPGEYELVTDLAPDSLEQPACLVIESDEVTVHGNGHTIDVSGTTYEGDGDREKPSCIAINPSGGEELVDWSTAVHEVELRGGRAGVDAQLTDGGEYTDLTAIENDTGFRFYVDGGTLEECVAANNGTGIDLGGDPDVFGGSSATIERCTFTSNQQEGIRIGHESRADITESRIVLNNTGVWASPLAQDSTVSGSHICRNDEFGVDAGTRPAEEDKPPEAEAYVEALENYWGASNGPSSHGDPEEPYEDPETGQRADGDGDAISESLEPGVSNVRFDPFQETTLEDVGADR